MNTDVSSEELRGLLTGEEWAHIARNKGACAVIYFALERAHLVKRKLRAYAERNRADLPIAVVALTINLMDEKVVDEIDATIDAVEQEFGKNVGLLIVDTLPKGIAAGGGDEDKARDQGKVYANIQRIKDRRGPHAPHVALLCHPGKDVSRGPRGSNASTGDFDVQIEIAGTDIRTVTITKNSDGPDGFLGSFKPVVHDFGKDEDGDPIEVCLAEPIEGASAPASPEPKLSANQTTMFTLLHSAASTGLTTTEWNERAREAGLGVKRKADLVDLREALKSKGRVRQYGDRWTVNHGV
jgi:AAA domain